jgi:hypothetical protein
MFAALLWLPTPPPIPNHSHHYWREQGQEWHETSSNPKPGDFIGRRSTAWRHGKGGRNQASTSISIPSSSSSYHDETMDDEQGE